MKSPDFHEKDLFDQILHEKDLKPAEEIWSVTRLSSRIKRAIEDGLPQLWVEGEISNFKLHSSGHRYFTLKDETAQIACVMWRTRGSANVPLRDGIKVRAYGRVTVWEQAGKYQFDIQDILPSGIGSLQAAFEQLKNQLAAEGLFDTSRKKPLPRFPRRIGIVTSPTGAVIHDLAWGITTRFPPAKIVLLPVAVQGAGAGAQIANAIDLINRQNLSDLIIIGRGGGSLEDLWAFNEEVVVRAICGSRIPVVSAVGHEVDFTLSDLAADLRAPTPTAAAALVVPDRKELLEGLAVRRASLLTQLDRRIVLWNERLKRINQSYSFKRLPGRINDERLKIDELLHRCEISIGRKVQTKRTAVTAMAAQFNALSPEAVLKRGFSIARKTDGSLVRSSQELNIEDTINLIFAKGKAAAVIRELSDR